MVLYAVSCGQRCHQLVECWCVLAALGMWRSLRISHCFKVAAILMMDKPTPRNMRCDKTLISGLHRRTLVFRFGQIDEPISGDMLPVMAFMINPVRLPTVVSPKLKPNQSLFYTISLPSRHGEQRQKRERIVTPYLKRA